LFLLVFLILKIF